MKRLFVAACAAALFAAGAASADTISGGQTQTETVLGTASIYHVFGHAGGNGSAGPDTAADLLTFTAGAGNVFSFTATGEIGCCGGLNPGFTPDGAGGGTNITGRNGLSNISGNSLIPLVGVFTTDTDPFGGAAPAALAFNAGSPTSLSPLLNQVFYIGDGLTGYNNASGSSLSFTAPTTATRLYLGVIDANGFNGPTDFYGDNPGSFTVNASLTAPTTGGGVPEPAAWAMMLMGFFGLGATLRGRKSALA